MKSYTDIEQSKKLAKILPIESADLWWAERYTGTVKENGEYIVDETPFYYRSLVSASATNYSQDTINDIPAWSLAALLNAVDFSTINLYYNNARTDWVVSATIHDSTKHCTKYESTRALNPVDACVDMIIKLHEQKIL